MPGLTTVSDGKRSHSSDGEQRSKSAKCFDEDDNEQMRVVKRDGRYEKLKIEKIMSRLESLSDGLTNDHLDHNKIVLRISQGIHNNITTREMDNLAASIAASMSTIHPDYGLLAARIAISSHQKETLESFSATVAQLYNNSYDGVSKPIVTREFYDVVMKNKKVLDAAIKHERDFLFTYFGFKTLELSYLQKCNEKPIERPQYLLMRVAVSLHQDNIPAALETYELLSQKYFTHATPTLFNAGTNRNQLSSCFLFQIIDDSIDGIFETLKQTALIAKHAGGIGICISNIRSTGSKCGFGGKANGIMPMIRVFAASSAFVSQGGNKRPGSIALYLEPWHADLMIFLEIRKNQGIEEQRARNLFTGLLINDLFMERVEKNEDWSLFCPKICPGLQEAYGDEFKELYTKYEKEGKAQSVMNARKIWNTIIENQIETGTPYMVYKDSVNKKNQQSNLGTIKCSNLCAEIIEYVAPDEVAVCNLASICLANYVDVKEQTFDFKKLFEVTKVIANNLDLVIDQNLYPIQEAKNSNMKHRPMGIGVQGLADTFQLLKLAFDSEKARTLNRNIFETIYFAAITKSCENAKLKGCYSSYEGSPASKGLLQFDLWNEKPQFEMWDWDSLKVDIAKYGLRNSLFTTCMPTASTSNIMGLNECIEPYTSNLYVRRVLSGEFQIVNAHLIKQLIELNLWNKSMKNELVANNGSVQKIKEIPDWVKLIYRTVWEIPQKSLIEMSASRAPFVDQTQSLNIFIAQPNFQNMTSMHFYGWKKGLKTGMYYLRSKPATNAIQFTVDKSDLNKAGEELGKNNSSGNKTNLVSRQMSADRQKAALLCAINNGDSCDMCGS